MDARRMQISNQINVAQGNKSWQLPRVTTTQRVERQEVLFWDCQDGKGAHEPHTQERAFNPSSIRN